MKKLVLLLSLLLCCIFSNIYAGGEKLWTQEYPKEINWMMVSDAGILILGTDEALYGVNPETGEELWKQEDQKKIDREYVEVIDVTPVILVTRKGLRNEAVAINTLTGEAIFSTKDYNFMPMHGAMPVYDNLTFLLAGVEGKSRSTFYNVDMATGEVNWKQDEWLGPKSGDPQLVALNQEKTFSKLGLIGNQYVVFDTDNTFFAHLANGHLAKYDMRTGEMIWQANFKDYKVKPKPEGASSIAYGYAQMRYNEANNTLYVPISNSLVALNADDGSFVWGEKPEDLKGKVSNMEFIDEGILVKTTGEKPIITLLDYNTGEPLWDKEFKKFQDNGVVLFEEDKILLLTGNDLYEIKPVNGEYERVAKNIKFKGEDPMMMSIVEDVLVFTANQNIMGMDPDTYEVIYQEYYAAPGLGALEIVGRALAAAAANAMSYASARHAAMSGGANYDPISNTFEYDVVSANLGQRFSKSLETNKYHYVNTKECVVEGNKDKGVICINKLTGEIDGAVILEDRKPEYEVDQVSNLLFFKSGKKEVTCYKL